MLGITLVLLQFRLYFAPAYKNLNLCFVRNTDSFHCLHNITNYIHYYYIYITITVIHYIIHYCLHSFIIIVKKIIKINQQN